MSRALITGGADFIGSHLSEALLERVWSELNSKCEIGRARIAQVTPDCAAGQSGALVR